MNILGIGVATLDVINEVAAYPREDAEVRTVGQRLVRGGNVTNALVVLSQLGHQCAWAGTLADDMASELILRDLDAHHIDTTRSVRCPGTATPTSYITLSRTTGSRTIVHHRDLPELAASLFQSRGLEQMDWVHLEGRNPEQTCRIIKDIRRLRPDMPLSVEIEKPRAGIETLLTDADLLLFSRFFARAKGLSDPVRFFRQYPLPLRTQCVLGWGADGAYAREMDGTLIHCAGYQPERVVDTVGAGDVLNAAVIHGLLSQKSLEDAVTRAVRLAGAKCGQAGFAGLLSNRRDGERSE